MARGCRAKSSVAAGPLTTFRVYTSTMSDLVEVIRCPACDNRLARCKGVQDMPASREYWHCVRCGLNAHHSRLVSAATRDELRREYESTLRQRIRDGRVASGQLQMIRKGLTANAGLAGVVAGLGLVSATLLYRLLSRYRSHRKRKSSEQLEAWQ